MRTFRRAIFAGVLASVGVTFAVDTPIPSTTSLEWMVPDASLQTPVAQQVPIKFVSRGSAAKEWDALPTFWNEVTEEVIDPTTGTKSTRKVVKLKQPLGINVVPVVPVENPMTAAKWELGKKLYYDTALSSSGTVSCATCHDPAKGFTDQSKVSTGIGGAKGGMNSPTVINSAFNRFQFWDGRAGSLEEQAQGPVGNSAEMFGGKGNAWHETIRRLRANPDYMKAFEKEFGHAPTRDAAAKAIAVYERTVMVGNSIHDRAELAMRTRVLDEDGNKFELKPVDYATVLKTAFAAQDKHALEALQLTDPSKLTDVANGIDRGRLLFFGKARCNNCHVGESFTDHAFHNLGIGVMEGKLPEGQEGRFGSQTTGHKDPSVYGAFKTPGLRALLQTMPYMHDGSEKTLEAVVDFYDRGGNVNEFLDSKMRDVEAEEAYRKTKTGTPAMLTRDGSPIIPKKLGLTPDEKKDLVLFLRALESDPVDPKVASGK